MARRTRSRIPGKDEQKRQLLAALKPADFPSLVADILYFSKGHRHVKVMDGPGDGCRDIQSLDKDETAVITQCKCFADTMKSVGSPNANELVVALTKFGQKRGIMATNGRFSPQLKREFTDGFPDLHLDWLDGADIVDEVFSNPLLFRVWVTGDALGRETIFVKVPFVVRRAFDDAPLTIEDANLRAGLTVEGDEIVELGRLERFRPPQSVGWSESFGPRVYCAAVLSTSPPDLHALELLDLEVLVALFSDTREVLTVRFGEPFLVPTKTPRLAKGMTVPGFSPRSYIVRPGKPPMAEQEFLLLKAPNWTWPDYLSMAEGDWGNWQTPDNQRWCHINVRSPSFPGATQSQICRMIGDSTRRDLTEAGAIFITSTREECQRLRAGCTIEPDVCEPNGPGGELLGWFFRDKNKREVERAVVSVLLADNTTVEVLDLEDAIHITARTDSPILPSPADEVHYPAELVWAYEDLPSPHFLKGRSCVFVEFWEVPADLSTGRQVFDGLSLPIPEGWTLHVRCSKGPKTKKVFPMISVEVPWPLDRSTTELVEEMSADVDKVFVDIARAINAVWPNAHCATSEFWETEVRFPAGMYVPTEKGMVRTDWWPEHTKEGDD